MRQAVLDWLGVPTAYGTDLEALLKHCQCYEKKSQNRGQSAEQQQQLHQQQQLEELQVDYIGSVDAANHLHNCKYGGGTIARHNAVMNSIVDMLVQAGKRPTAEPRATFQETGKGGPDIFMHDFPTLGVEGFVEVAVVNEAQDGECARAAKVPLVAAIRREKLKKDKYLDASIASRAPLVAAVVEAHGAFGPGLRALLRHCETSHKTIASSTAYDGRQRPWTSTSFLQYHTQRISCALRRGAAIMVDSILYANRCRIAMSTFPTHWSGRTQRTPAKTSTEFGWTRVFNNTPRPPTTTTTSQ
jgi:hypothetical protein